MKREVVTEALENVGGVFDENKGTLYDVDPAALEVLEDAAEAWLHLNHPAGLSPMLIAVADHETTIRDQLEVYRAFESGACVAACAGAADPLSECDCTCASSYHGQLWIRNFFSLYLDPQELIDGRPDPRDRS